MAVTSSFQQPKAAPGTSAKGTGQAHKTVETLTATAPSVTVVTSISTQAAPRATTRSTQASPASVATDVQGPLNRLASEATITQVLNNDNIITSGVETKPEREINRQSLSSPISIIDSGDRIAGWTDDEFSDNSDNQTSITERPTSVLILKRTAAFEAEPDLKGYKIPKKKKGEIQSISLPSITTLFQDKNSIVEVTPLEDTSQNLGLTNFENFTRDASPQKLRVGYNSNQGWYLKGPHPKMVQETDSYGGKYYPLPNRFYTLDPIVANQVWTWCENDPNSFSPHSHPELWDDREGEITRAKHFKCQESDPNHYNLSEFQAHLDRQITETKRRSAHIDQLRRDEHDIIAKVRSLRADLEYYQDVVEEADQAAQEATTRAQVATAPAPAPAPPPPPPPPAPAPVAQAPTPPTSDTGSSGGSETGVAPQQSNSVSSSSSGAPGLHAPAGPSGQRAAGRSGQQSAQAGSNLGGTQATRGPQASGSPVTHHLSGAQYQPLPVPRGYSRDALMGRAGPPRAAGGGGGMPAGTAPNVPARLKYFTHETGRTVEFGRLPRRLASRFVGTHGQETPRINYTTGAKVAVLNLQRAQTHQTAVVTLTIWADGQDRLHAGVYACYHRLEAVMGEQEAPIAEIPGGKNVLQTMGDFILRLTQDPTFAPGATKMSAIKWR